jgi:hypothetical protein
MKTSLNKHWLAAGLVSLTLITSGSLYAQDYGIHFLGGTTDPVTGSAGVVPISGWNNFDNVDLTSGTITSSGGSQTASMTLSGVGANRGWNNGTGNGGDTSLNDGYIDCGWTSSAQNAIVTISGLSSGQVFTVYLYAFGNSVQPQQGSVWLNDYTVNGVDQWVGLLGVTASNPGLANSGTVPYGPWSSFGYVLATPFSSNFNTGLPSASDFGDYLEFTGVAATGGQIVIADDNDGKAGRSALDGIELVSASPVPEPSVMALAGLGVSLLFVIRRRLVRA